MLFITTFATFIVILTIFENIFLALLIRFLICIRIFIQSKIQKQNNFLSKFGLVTLALVISFISICVHSYTYNQKLSNIPNNTGLISQNADGPQGQYFVGNGEISDIYSYHKYIFRDNAGREYFLKSTNTYQIGDIIWLNGYVSLGYTGSINIFNFQKQRNNLQSGHFLSGLFHYKFDYPKREMMKGYYGTINEQKSIIIDSLNQNISRIQKIRRSLQKNIISAYGETPQAGLVLGMLVGDRSQIPSNDYQNFIDSGLVHIIAVSGGNIVMIVVFLSAILFFLPFYIRNAVILATIICYAMICGLDSSVFRATIMGGLSLLALFWGRQIDIRRAMGIAFIIMLIINPYFLVYDVGFLLSFSAIVGIVFLTNFANKVKKEKQNNDQNLTKKRNKFTKLINQLLSKCVSDYILPTIGATLGVLPIMLFFMGGTNIISIIANFFVTPIIAIVMIYGFISTILYGIIPREIRLRPEKILIKYIYFISDLTVKHGIYLQAIGDWIKYLLLFLFIIRLIIKLSKKEK